jgi:glycosyltransferase involved in cell wall biosynthesis
VILLSHPTANQNVRQTALALAAAELLEEFWTCVNWKQNTLCDRLLSSNPRIQNELRRRSFAPELQPFIRTSSWREWGRLLFGQFGLAPSSLFSVDAVYDSLDRRVARRLVSSERTKAVYAYDGGALETFRAAKKSGVKCIYEHPIVYWRKVRDIQREEAERHPKWAPTLPALRDSDEKLARKDEELALADVIVTPSVFSRESLASAPGLKASIHLIPYGAPAIQEPRDDESHEKLRVLFVGALSQAKGLGYLLEAASRFEGHIELTLIGQRVSTAVPTQAVLDRYRHLPSLPHDQLLAEMAHHDVLALPSLHEGFGLVMLEAMAQGVVPIATDHTGAPDVIEDCIDGFIIPIRSADAIAEKLDLLLQDRARLGAMKNAARRKAAASSWENYRKCVVALARNVIAN